jgi:hypothetical protein
MHCGGKGLEHLPSVRLEARSTPEQLNNLNQPGPTDIFSVIVNLLQIQRPRQATWQLSKYSSTPLALGCTWYNEKVDSSPHWAIQSSLVRRCPWPISPQSLLPCAAPTCVTVAKGGMRHLHMLLHGHNNKINKYLISILSDMGGPISMGLPQ